MSAPAPQGSDARAQRLRRIVALIRKETYQVFRDPSSIAIGIVTPVVLLILFGYGLSLDVKNVPIAIVLEDSSPLARDAVSGFTLSTYFDPEIVHSMPEAERRMLARDVDGIVRVPPDFSRRFAAGDAEIQVLVHGTDANTARIVLGYAQGAIGQWTARQRAAGQPTVASSIRIESRLWFNEANDSSYFLVPGLIVLVMTLIGALLTALVMAREWERGTFEALFVTPCRSVEILLGKTVPYFVLGLAGLALCVVGSRVLFDVPLRGSLSVLIAVSMLYLLVALGIGLVISSLTKSQFLASQLALLVSFLPATMLSGFLFDLRSMPDVIRAITYVLPARYYVALLQTLFLAGDIWSVILPNAAALAVMAVLLLAASIAATRKRLD